MNRTQRLRLFATSCSLFCCAATLLAQAHPPASDSSPNAADSVGKTVVSQCPVTGAIRAFTSATDAVEPQKYHGNTAAGTMSNRDWWPSRLNLDILHQNAPSGNPFGEDFDYVEEFKTLDLEAVKSDINEVMTTSQDWWAADYGHYGPFFIRMAWHSAGTYRSTDGRGGARYGLQRFAPLNSWPDNGNLDKARRLLWPIKQKYGRKLSWADLMILTGNCALESMGLETFGFSGGRVDVWEPQADIDWGPETEWLADERYTGDRELENPLAAVQMGLIYVNPEGPNGEPNPLAAAIDIRETFTRMGVNDVETVALIAGGHTFGKAHGAASAENVGPEPEAAGIAEQGFGWKNRFGTGNAGDTITSGLEGAWTSTPTQWSSDYFDNLFGYEWKQVKSPAGAWQWVPEDPAAANTVPDAHDEDQFHPPMMFTTDLALRFDPAYAKISKRFHEHPEEFAKAFAKAWYKLTHRDMGPVSRLVGEDVPEAQLWQDPIPAIDYKPIEEQDVAALKSQILNAGLAPSELVATAWSSASTFRGSDFRGGANGARVRLLPQRDWEANDPTQLAKVLQKLEKLQKDFNESAADGKQVSIADLIVLGGAVGIEEGARKAGLEVSVPFTPGRADTTQELTDVESFALMEPLADGFRNYSPASLGDRAEFLLVNRAQQLNLSAPEMTVLIGGLRALDANHERSPHGVLTERPGTLSHDFFVNLLDMNTVWEESADAENVFVGRDRKSGEPRWTASRVDLVFGSNSQLRAIAEVYASDDAQQKFLDDFVAAWTKVMTLDRFDLDSGR